MSPVFLLESIQDAMLVVIIAVPKTTNEPAESRWSKTVQTYHADINVHLIASALADRALSSNHGNQVRITKS